MSATTFHKASDGDVVGLLWLYFDPTFGLTKDQTLVPKAVGSAELGEDFVGSRIG